MKILVNGDSRELSAQSVALALSELGLANAVVATAHNGEFIPLNARETTMLSDGDRLEVLAPMQGG
jgi:sulfur carrier protein